MKRWKLGDGGMAVAGKSRVKDKDPTGSWRPRTGPCNVRMTSLLIQNISIEWFRLFFLKYIGYNIGIEQISKGGG